MELLRPLPFFAALAFAAAGCLPPAPSHEYEMALKATDEADESRAAIHAPEAEEPLPAELTGQRPVEAFVERALRENRKLQAEQYQPEVRARLTRKVDQALDDPRVQNTIRPFPNYGPQYSLMGYMPYSLMLSQELPWFGTLAIRGEKGYRPGSCKNML